MCGLLKRDNSGLFLDFASCERTDLGYMCQFPPNKGIRIPKMILDVCQFSFFS